MLQVFKGLMDPKEKQETMAIKDRKEKRVKKETTLISVHHFFRQ